MREMWVVVGWWLWIDFSMVFMLKGGVLWFSMRVRWSGWEFSVGGVGGRTSVWREIVLGGKVASIWVRGLVWGEWEDVGEGGRVICVGVRMTVRKGSVLEMAAVVIALVMVGVVDSDGTLIHVKELVKNVGRGEVCAPR